MGDIFTKTMRWFICCVFFIIGVYCIDRSNNTGSVNPIIFSVFSFGMVYILSKSFYELPRKLLVVNVAVMIGTAIAATFLSYGYGFFVEWTFWSLVIGAPIMATAFAKS